jgi:hypothetical protein
LKTTFAQKHRINQKALAKEKRRFLRIFPEGFDDEYYSQWERDYKWEAHKLFKESLNKEEFKRLLQERAFSTIAARALKAEGRTTFLFSFEKIALRDALRTESGARGFAEGLYNFLYVPGPLKQRFIEWIVEFSRLPRIKARVLSWPNLTIFPYLAQPSRYMILKPKAMITAARSLGFDFDYSAKPSFRTYESLMELADLTKEAISDLNPRNYHDIQTFLWVIGSAEYERIFAEVRGIDPGLP